MARQYKFIFIIIVVLFILIASFLLFAYLGRKNSDGTLGNTTKKIATLPNVNNSPDTDAILYAISNVQNNLAIKNAFETYVDYAPEYYGDLPKKFQFVDRDNRLVSLDVLNVMGLDVNSEVKNRIDNNRVDFIVCKGKKESEVEFGLIFHLKENSQDTGSLMLGWESKMFQDLHKIIFPNTTFSDSGLKQNLVFQNGEYRYAKVNFPGGGEGSVNYTVQENQLIVAPSLNCMNEVVSKLINK